MKTGWPGSGLRIPARPAKETMAKTKSKTKIIIFSIVAAAGIGAGGLCVLEKNRPAGFRGDGESGSPQSDRESGGQRQDRAGHPGEDQPGSQRRNHRTGGQGRPAGEEGRSVGQDQAGQLSGRQQFRRRQLQSCRGQQEHGGGEPGEGAPGIRTQLRPLSRPSWFPTPTF